MSTDNEPQVDFSRFDGERVVVVINQAGSEFVFKGLAAFQVDESLGRVLRICADDACNGYVVISEASWQGRVITDTQYGCQTCFIPSSTPHDA